MQGLRNQLQQAQAQAQVQALPPVPPTPQPIIHHASPIPANPDLYERFRRMKAPDFKRSPDSLVADEWLAQM